MFKDIVEELRHAHQVDKNQWDVTLYLRASDEIERLRQLGDTLAYHVRAGEAKEMYSAVHAWGEARRG